MTPVTVGNVEVKTRKRGVFPVGTVILIVLVVIGAIAAVIRYTQGLGTATNLNDDVPWGLWIGLDVMAGVALSAGGFTMAAVVYVFRLKEYYPLIRPALLTAFIGYVLAAGAILFDLGRPDRFYHPFIYWNTHSVMFEIAWSVLTYLAILAVENSQWAMERLGLKRLLAILRKALIVVVVVGIIISTMHQSSLGGLFLITPQRLHPLWYTPILPILFYLTAIAVGLSMVVVETSLTNSALGRKPETKLLSKVAAWIPWVLLVYLVLNLGNLIVTGKLYLLFEGSIASLQYWLEILIGVVAPMVILFIPSLRQNRYWLFRAAALVGIGVVMNRFNILFWGQEGVLYSPSWMEFAVSAGLISLGILLFLVIVKYFPVLDHEAGDH